MPYQGGEIKQKSPTIFTGRRACPFQDGCNRTKNSVFFDAKIVQKTQKSLQYSQMRYLYSLRSITSRFFVFFSRWQNEKKWILTHIFIDMFRTTSFDGESSSFNSSLKRPKFYKFILNFAK